jgi:hypothetical protein
VPRDIELTDGSAAENCGVWEGLKEGGRMAQIGTGSSLGGSSGTPKKGTTPLEEKQFTDPPGILRDPSVAQARNWNTVIPTILPHEKVFPIQIGSELYRLSGASISSDGMCWLFV